MYLFFPQRLGLAIGPTDDLTRTARPANEFENAYCTCIINLTQMLQQLHKSKHCKINNIRS